MSSRKGNRKSQKGSNRKRQRTNRRKAFAVIGGLAGAAVVATAVLLVSRGSNPATEPASSLTPASAGEKPDCSKLIGNWMRPDGGYIINVRNVDPGGQVEAAYYNPRKIHVSRAEASAEGDAAVLFIKLEDVGYPGSTYMLRYDSKNDVLAGVYFQAAIQQSFDVVFVRMR
ncbi:MAG: hypothetical protein JSV16_10570 [Candidatus Hydrogenedentota bacterium]|nr:MAG: hypothetical protein JSV16_10570 [Candidatus Hydrogenedentota bacterium]